MKLYGNSRDARRIQGGRPASANTSNFNRRQQSGVSCKQSASKIRRRPRRTLKVLIAIFVILLAAVAALYTYLKIIIRPPDMQPPPTAQSAFSPAVNDSGDSPLVSADRKGNMYTFVIAGFDKISNSTDTLMVANFNTDNYNLNVVNIPRDTLVNVPWSVKKINTLYSTGGADGLVDGLADIFGFKVDFYVLIDLEAFEKLIDAVGGVDFYVPTDLDYEDAEQNLYIHFKEGMQHLNGEEAMEVVRDRHDYVNEDIGRIETQQKFLKAAIEQLIAKRNQLSITELSTIFLKYVKTDLTNGNVIWLGQKFFKMDAENITFTTLPENYEEKINGAWYCSIYIDKWLTVLNEKINPFNVDISATDLSILTRNSNGKLYVTNGVWADKNM